MAAPVVVRNPTDREESVGSGNEMRQTRESMPTIELVVHNVGEATVVLHRAQFTVRGHGIPQNCQICVRCGRSLVGVRCEHSVSA